MCLDLFTSIYEIINMHILVLLKQWQRCNRQAGQWLNCAALKCVVYCLVVELLSLKSDRQ
jgi:hypothetical protein